MPNRIDHYEDNYGATIYDTFEELMDEVNEYWIGLYASLNWPIWVEYETDEEDDNSPVITIGVFMPRHGYCAQRVAPATPEQAQEIRAIVMRVWANRADAGFRRYTSRVVTEEAPR